LVSQDINTLLEAYLDLLSAIGGAVLDGFFYFIAIPFLDFGELLQVVACFSVVISLGGVGQYSQIL
jgi:hypothetical protein